MNVQDVEYRVAQVPRDMARGRDAQELIFADVLKAIAEGAADPVGLAKAALTAYDAVFPPRD